MAEAMWFLAQYLKATHPELYARVRTLPPEAREQFWPMLRDEIARSMEERVSRLEEGR